jgi:hypothetical protein
VRGLTIVLGLLAVLAAIFMAGCLALSSYTSGKLDRMRMIRGDVPGATFVTGTVRSIRATQSGQCELVVDAEGTSTKQWSDSEGCAATFAPGTQVTLARTPGEPGLELKNGTYVSDGNMAFDTVLLVIERVGAGVLACVALGLGIAAFFTHRRRSTKGDPNQFRT